MSDLISRQAAIDAIVAWTVEDRPDIEMPTDLVGRINALPPAQPERKRGKRIEDAETYYKEVNEKGGGVNEDTPYFTDDIACPECLSLFSVIDNETERFDFCPHCGAQMEDGRHG